MKTITSLCLGLILAAGSAQATEKEVWITTDQDVLEHKSHMKSFSVKELDVRDGVGLLKVKESDLVKMSEFMHHEFHRCGGYMFHDTEEEALAELNSLSDRLFATKSIVSNYSISEQDTVRPMIAQVQEPHIQSVIKKLSSFHNRYYDSDTGVASQQWLKSHWEKLTASRSDAQVEFYRHSSWRQPSVILKIEGSESPEDVIVIGGHADSIAGWWGRNRARAPGADDNASGMATISEIIRVMVETNYQPKKTIMFMGYAAEEVGLRGSKEIARAFKNNGSNVVGVLQLDMTNFKGSEWDIVLINDYTNRAQNEFIGTLIDEYLQVKWGYDKCGYACSDHASWTGQGFPASIPFESTKRGMNSHIHTDRDTIDMSGGDASHASKFAKLGVAYLVELDS